MAWREIGKNCKGPDTIHKPKAFAISVRWNGTLLPRRYWGGRVFGITAEFGDRMVGYNSIRGCVLGRSEEKVNKFLCQVASRTLPIWSVESSRSYVSSPAISLFPDDYCSL